MALVLTEKEGEIFYKIAYKDYVRRCDNPELGKTKDTYFDESLEFATKVITRYRNEYAHSPQSQ